LRQEVGALGRAAGTAEDVVGTGKNQITFDLVALDKACAYAAEDADITLRLHQSLKPRLVPERATTLYETIERPLAAVLAAVESEGILVDRAVLSNLSQDFATRLAAIEKEIYALAGHEFNIASPKQMGDVLFGEMKIAVGSKTKTGAWSTDAETLEELSAGGHVIADKILEWRQLAKLKSTYTDALQEQINPKTGRVHTSFHMTGTNTGRLSSTDPNLQNIPVRTVEGKKIRTAFVAPPGKLLISADYSQIELRLLAEMANVPGLKKAFHEGIDIHALTASEMFGVPVKDMDSDTRRKAKAINFGIIYGISAFGLAKQVGTSNAEARQFIDMYFSRFPEIRDFMEAQKEFCRKHLYVVTLFGRKCFIPDIGSKNGMQRSFGERQAINAPLQGTAADIIKRAMVKLPDAIAASKLDIKMLLQVHDELVFEAPEKDAEAAGALVQSVMQEAHLPAVKLGVPLNVDVTVAERWS
jgi:DNA polymerase-1